MGGNSITLTLTDTNTTGLTLVGDDYRQITFAPDQRKYKAVQEDGSYAWIGYPDEGVTYNQIQTLVIIMEEDDIPMFSS
jgi:hypothetical protein